MKQKLEIEIPAFADRTRILGTKQAAAVCDVSVAHFRRLYRSGKIPAPIRIGERKYGWQFGIIDDFLASKTAEAA